MGQKHQHTANTNRFSPQCPLQLILNHAHAVLLFIDNVRYKKSYIVQNGEKLEIFWLKILFK